MTNTTKKVMAYLLSASITLFAGTTALNDDRPRVYFYDKTAAEELMEDVRNNKIGSTRVKNNGQQSNKFKNQINNAGDYNYERHM